MSKNYYHLQLHPQNSDFFIEKIKNIVLGYIGLDFRDDNQYKKFFNIIERVLNR